MQSDVRCIQRQTELNNNLSPQLSGLSLLSHYGLFSAQGQHKTRNLSLERIKCFPPKGCQVMIIKRNRTPCFG